MVAVFLYIDLVAIYHQSFTVDRNNWLSIFYKNEKCWHNFYSEKEKRIYFFTKK